MSTYNGCGCTSEDCRVNGCLTQRQRNESGGVRVQAIEQERTAFEAWAWQRGYDLDAVMLLSKPPRFSRYTNPATQDAWEAYQAGRATLQSQDRVECTWETDEYTGAYDTDCGYSFTINDGGPSDNNMKFCCYCGKPIQEAIDHARRAEGGGE